MSEEFVLERRFAAPVATVWRAWTDPALLVRWYKPNPACATRVVHHELRAGGELLYEMRFGEMPASYERWLFEEIEPVQHLSWKQSLTDSAGNVVTNPRMPDWPRLMLTSITLVERGDETLQRLVWRPIEPTDAERACFANSAAFLDRGWVGAFENLARWLADS